MIVILAAAVIWLALAATRKRVPMLIGSAILAAAWLAQIDIARGASAAGGREPPPLHDNASVLAMKPKGSCASIAADMSDAEVKSRMGDPDEVRGDEETRGPGASIMTYRGSRCAVHLLDGKVEFVD